MTLWGTGFGPTDPPCATGGLNVAELVNLSSGLSVELFAGGPAGNPTVLYAGSAPTLLCGIVQIGMRVLSQTPPGVLQFSPWAVMTSTHGTAVSTTSVQNPVGVTIAVK